MQWFSVEELAGVKGLPSSARGIAYKAKSEQWQSRPRSGRGGGKEYHLDSLPEATRIHLLLEAGKVQVGETVFELPKDSSNELTYCREALWYAYDKASEKHKAKAKQKYEMAVAVTELRKQGVGSAVSINTVADKFNSSFGTVTRIFNKTKGYEQADWITLFVPAYKARKSAMDAEFTPDAWAFFKADYLRLEKPCLTTCLERTKIAGQSKGWIIPSESSVHRKIQRDIPEDQIVLLREGSHALLRMYPGQQRTVEQMHALEHINGDGYQHNVFVKWHNGEVLRPKTWFWQDIYSRKILGYYVDVSENTDMIRLALMSVIEQYGIPKEVTIDNTRAAANKNLTAGVPNRYRFKVKEDDPKGIIPMLGIKLHWTSIKEGKGWGQAKPVERCFGVGGLEEMIDKHPLNAGGYTGANPMAKPDNYGSKAIPVAEFLKTVEAGVNQFNSRLKRETEICKGLMSFDEAFSISYQSSAITKATTEQLRLLLLCSEAVRVLDDGTFTLKAGGKIKEQKNRYSNLELIGMRLTNNKIAVKFDPRNLHNSVLCYTLDGRFICEAECIDKVAFNDRTAAREQERQRTRFTKATKLAAKAQQQMHIGEVAAQMPEVTPPELPETKIVEIFQPIGNAIRKAEIEINPDDREEAFGKAIALFSIDPNEI